jgi:hypothetical protein
MHDVDIEVVLLSLRAGTELGWRLARSSLPAGCAPDARARELAGLGTAVSAATVVHSTSWRPTPAGLVLTYAVLPDPDPAAGLVRALPREARLAYSADPAAPTPAVIEVEHVLAHAVRHLSLLARSDPVVASAADAHPQLWHAVLTHTPEVAGQLVPT